MDPEAFSKCSQTSFHTKLYASTYLHRNLKTHSVSSNRPRKLIEPHRTKPNARILANEPKQSNLLNETTRETSRKHVFTSKPKTALRIIESTPKTDQSTPNESKARETANEPKQRASRNETTRQTVSTNALDCEHFECEGVVYDSVFLDLDGQIFFEIIALTLAIRWHATCRY